jgi:hypothetical protein
MFRPLRKLYSRKIKSKIVFLSRRTEKAQNLKKMDTLTFKSLINSITKNKKF